MRLHFHFSWILKTICRQLHTSTISILKFALHTYSHPLWSFSVCILHYIWFRPKTLRLHPVEALQVAWAAPVSVDINVFQRGDRTGACAKSSQYGIWRRLLSGSMYVKSVVPIFYKFSSVQRWHGCILCETKEEEAVCRKPKLFPNGTAWRLQYKGMCETTCHGICGLVTVTDRQRWLSCYCGYHQLVKRL